MKPKKFDAYLYDLDGTLLDSFPDLIHAIKQTLKPLHINNELELRKQVSFGGKAMMECAINGRLDCQQSAKKLEQFIKTYYANSTKLSSLFDGIKKVVNHHKNNHQKWAIVSNKEHFATELIAKAYHLEADIVLGRGFLKHAKPHPEPLLYVCDKLKVHPEQCLFIGDHSHDILAAKNANMNSALASWGYIADLNQLIALKPDYVLNHPKELINL